MPKTESGTVKATGEVGEVYKTSTGMELADVEKDISGWKQISPTSRVLVRSEDHGGHQCWWVWVQD